AADGERGPKEIGEAAAPGVAAVAAGPALAADCEVVVERAVVKSRAQQSWGEEVGRMTAAADGETAVLAGAACAGDRRVVLERAVADRGRPSGDVDTATERVVGAENAGRWIAALIVVAADGLIVVERARAEHQRG